MEQMKIHRTEFCPTVLRPERPYWVLQHADIELIFLNIKHRNKYAYLVQEFYIHRYQKYSEHVQLYTDGSKNPQTDATGAAVVIPRYQIGICKRTLDWVSVYAVELEWAEGIQDRKILICSDSVSSMLSIKSGACKVHQDIIYEILLTNTRLFSQGKEKHLCGYQRTWA